MSVAGQQVDMKYLPSRKGDIRVSVGAPNLSEQSLNFRAVEPLASGLQKLINYDHNEQAKKQGFDIDSSWYEPCLAKAS